ncbi:MAG: carboxypeptidase-like regulatory domain-containing protein, partial [Myxococcota bacterium]|nr:carboxypeptidase-like regulatory domain-containing protein [Myxococcota bacterium]
RGLAAGEWKLAATATGYGRAQKTVTIRIGRVLQDVALELARGATLAGVVRDRHGRRVAGAKVRLGTASTITDADGNFRLTDVPTGRGILEAEHAEQRGELTLDLAPASERLSLAVELAE